MSDVYEILNVAQGSDEWLARRLRLVTGSQTPSLLGLSPYQTMYELLEEKISRKAPEVNSFKQRLFEKGHEAELAAREWVEKDVGFKLPGMVLLSKRCSGLLASLDGFNPEENIMLEAKYMGAKALEEVKKGKIKPHHECQVQAGLFASGAKYCIYFATTDEDSVIVHIKPKADYQEKIISAVASFMKDFQLLEEHRSTYETFRDGLLSKYKMDGQSLKVLASGAKDPFRIKAR